MTRCGEPSGRVGRAVLLLLAAFAVPSWGLDLSQGRLELTLYEGIGRFSLAWKTEGGSARSVSLLSSEDPRTSMLTLVMGNKVYAMGESPDFSERVERTEEGARFVWKSPFLQVTEAFSFIPAAGSTAVSGVRIDLTMKNLSSQNASVGVRYLFDTWLGEAGFVHFQTDALSQVTHETALTPGEAAWWLSPLPGDPDSLGFQVMLAGEAITAPDRVVFANWKRLTDSPWSFDISTVRTFSLLPYSANDSAACQYYMPRTIAAGQEMSITLALGRFSKAGFSLASPSAAAATAQSAATSPTPVAPEEQGARAKVLRADLTSLDAILAEIDAGLAAGKLPSADALDRMQAALKEISGRLAGSSSATGK